MSEYAAIALGDIAGMIAGERSRRDGEQFIAAMEARKNRPPQVDVASFHKLINDYNQRVAEIGDLQRQIARRETIIAEKDLELAKKDLALANLTGQLHQTEFKLKDEQREGAASVRTIGQFLKAYSHYRKLLGIRRGDDYDVPGYW